MSWLDDALASIAASGEVGTDMAAPQKTARERELEAALAAGGSAAPMSLAGPSPNPLGLAGSFPTSQPQEKYTDYASGWPQEMTRPAAKFPDLPPQAPPPPPGMAAQPAVAGLNSPMGGAPGGGAPFSIAGAPPSLAAAQQMTAPAPPAPQMAQQPPVPGLVPPGAALGVSQAPGGPLPPGPSGAAPVVAQDDGEEDAPKATATDVSSRNRTLAAAAIPGAPAPAAATPAAPQRSLIDRIGDVGPGMIALGAGLSGHGWGQAQELAAARSKKEDALAEQALTQNLTGKALVAKGVDPATVAAAVRQPELLKALIGEHFGKSKYKVQKIGQDQFGGEQYAAVNENDPTDVVPIGGAKGAGATAGSGGGGYLAQGVTAVDPSKSGEEYLAQFSPEAQASVKDYVSGLATPTGNPRKGWAENIQKIAKKYGSDIGVPVDDTTFAQRRTYRNELAKNSPNTAGGQVKSFSQLLNHMSSLADNIEKQQNVNGGGFPDVAEAANKTRQHWSNENAARAKAVESDAQSAAGEIGKLFSGSQGGGVHERELTRSRFGSTSSQPVSAAALESTLELAQGGLQALEGRRDEILGAGRGPAFVGPKEQSAIDHIKGVIARLKGEQPAAGAVKPGKYVWTPDKGLVSQ